MSQLFNHARLILADRVIERGALETVNGVITAIHLLNLKCLTGLLPVISGMFPTGLQKVSYR